VLAGIELPPAIWQLHTGLYENSRFGLKQRYEETEELQTFTAINAGKVLKSVEEDDGLEGAHTAQVGAEGKPGELTKFRDTLPEVRRVLANISTYMIFDDHEVTDDWNLSQIWRDRVFTSPLGRTILRNGLLGYCLCQGWGNDPAAFLADTRNENGSLEPSPRKRLLAAIPRLFPAGDDLPPNREAADEIDLLLGLDGSDPPVKWHYSVDGPRHRVLAIDNRTRRAFASRTAPPTNLSPSAIRDQVPDVKETPLPAHIEVVVVIAPLPFFGLPVFDELGGPIAYRAYDLTHHRDISGLPGTNPDAGEAWSNVPVVFEEVLARLARYRRVVILSGDVHYAHSAEASYWFRGDQKPARFAQFTSSGMKNVWPEFVVLLNRSFAFATDVLQLFSTRMRAGWSNHEPNPLQLPPDSAVSPGVRDALVRSPLLLPGAGWPEGTTFTREPDWAWTLKLSVDERPRSSLPAGAKPGPLDPENPTADAPLNIEGYRQAARRHGDRLEKTTHTRTVLFASNFGMVTFTRGEQGLAARHDLFSRPGGAGTAAVFTSHTVALDVPDETMPQPGPGE
jgi:hypothetical protein